MISFCTLVNIPIVIDYLSPFPHLPSMHRSLSSDIFKPSSQIYFAEVYNEDVVFVHVYGGVPISRSVKRFKSETTAIRIVKFAGHDALHLRSPVLQFMLIYEHQQGLYARNLLNNVPTFLYLSNFQFALLGSRESAYLQG